MNFITLSSKISAKKAAIEFLQEKGILHNSRRCIHGHEMTLYAANDRWRCTCRIEIGILRVHGSKDHE